MFIGVSGPRPGVEALAVPVFAIVLVVTSSYWSAIPVAIAVFAGVSLARTFMTVARTDVNVLVIETGRRRLPARDSALTRLPTDGDRHGRRKRRCICEWGYGGSG